MILHHKGLKLSENLLRFKKGFKYSEDLSFIPLFYNKKELLIQSPNMYIPFEVKKYSEKCKKRYLDITFQNLRDKETLNFIENLSVIFNKVNKVYGKYDINEFIKQTDIYKWMRFKLEDDSLFFNQNKERINYIPNKTMGVFIFSLNGLWLMKDKVWFNWTILQSKIYTPIKLKEYIFIDDEEKEKDTICSYKVTPIKRIPPPPPPPPPPPMMKQNSNSIKDQISKNKKNGKKNNKTNNNFTPSIDEIMLAIKTLNKV